MTFDENDLREIERARDLPPDELAGCEAVDPEDCEHEAVRLVMVYRERRLVCERCGTHTHTEVLL